MLLNQWFAILIELMYDLVIDLTKQVRISCSQSKFSLKKNKIKAFLESSKVIVNI